MPTIDLRFPAEARLALAQLADALDDSRTAAVADAAEIPADADEDLAALWHRELLDGVRTDMGALRRLLATPDFGRRPVPLAEDDAFAALRGLTVLRLTIRERLLAHLPDEALETGEIARRALTPATRHAYACYGAFGEIQAALTDALDT